MHRTTYRPGAWNVLVTEHVVVALPEDTDVSLLSALWDGSERCRDLTVLIEMLTGAVGGSLSALPAFGAVILDDGVVRVAVRGTVSVTVDIDGEPTALTGAAASTWSEHLLQGATRVHLRAEDTAQPELPLIGGVVRAGELTIVTHDDERPGASRAIETDAAPAAASEHQVPTEALPVAEAMPVADASPAQPQDAGQVREQTPEPESGPEPEPVADAATADLPVPPTFFPSVVGVPAAVLASPVEDIVRTIVPEPEPEPVAEPVAEHAQDPEPETSDIDEFEMLWAQTVHRPPRGDATPTEPLASESDLGDHDGATITAAQARDLRRPAVDQEASTMVLPVVGQGRLRMSTGQEITLDRPVVIGRRPRATRASGDTLPRLVAVESPQQDISRNHLEVRPEADTVVIIDLHTTNGTTLLRQGAEPLRLHPGEPTLVVDGDTVDLGDGVTLVFEGLA